LDFEKAGSLALRGIMRHDLLFHPAVTAWFDRSFSAATAVQAQAWPAIHAGCDTLIAAPTGSGKTLAAFLAALDSLVRQGVKGELKDETQIIYVSPLKALSNDIQRNLEGPLAGIRDCLREQGLPDVEIRTWVRTGDTPSAERDRMRRRPPHIIVTTPESLYILLGSESGRGMLSTTRAVIVDEIHAMAGNKRGSHLSLSLERLAALSRHKVVRIGLSATQKPIEDIAYFLTGVDEIGTPHPCTIIDAGHQRKRDLALELPPSPLEAVMSKEVWEENYNRMAELIRQHRTTLIFVNTRRLVERITGQLSDRLGTDTIAAHHGSLSKEQRFDAEERLKFGKLKALVATASLELGIDIGDVDLVCQVGSPRSIAAFLQRVGRSGHAVNGTPKGRLFPLSRDELVECTALIDSVRRGELDKLVIPQNALDVLAQQIVAETAARDWDEESLFALLRKAWTYRNLPREDFSAVVRMLAEGFTTRRGRRGSLIHHDAVNRVLRGRRGARLTAITSGGAIPDNADYRVLLEPENTFIGTVNEDFAVESMSGDIFQLGNHSYRIMRVERGTVRVEDANGMPPSIPFWLGEAPGRTDELSQSVSRLRLDAATRLAHDPSGASAMSWLMSDIGLSEIAARELVEYLMSARAAFACLPTQETIVFERFFDEAGGMQLVIHSPYGSRINRAWGLALRKRFCRQFNFELQAAATEDNIVLSLTAAHSFELLEVARYLHSASVAQVLTQALLDAPMFTTRWRWVTGISLALPRFRGGRKIAPQLARMDAEDLLGAVFPDQVACGENLVGEREIPDHPLVNQTIGDCLNEAMDLDGLVRLLKRIESGEVRIVGCDVTQPSPFALEVLSARPYAFLDDAPLEERRTQAVMSRRWLAPDVASDLGNLDRDAVERVRGEAWPDPVNADELHDGLVWLGFLSAEDIAAKPEWRDWLSSLAVQKRITRLHTGQSDIWIAAERLPQFQSCWPHARLEPAIQTPAGYERSWEREEALVEILRGRLEGSGPVMPALLAAPLALKDSELAAALASLERGGFAMRGRFTPGANAEEWCERRLLARIHSYTVKRLRAEIEPVAARDFLRFLFRWQRVSPGTKMEGPEAADAVLSQLEGFEAPAAAWEEEILPARLARYEKSWIDDRCLAGQIAWARLRPLAPNSDDKGRVGPVRTTPITFLARRNVGLWMSLPPEADTANLGPRAQAVLACIRQNGAMFFDEIAEQAGLLRAEAEAAVGELVAVGLVTSDGFGGLRNLVTSSKERNRRSHRVAARGMDSAGRWALTRRVPSNAQKQADAVEHVARTLLKRYGVVFWRLLPREAEWLPPWRDLLRVYRKLESRGEIRGGRFVAGFTGEQFALPDAIGALRTTRRETGENELVSLSGADPLNLAGFLTPGPRLAALTGNRVLYRDGIPVAFYASGEVEFLAELDAQDKWQAQKVLLRSRGATPNSARHDTRAAPKAEPSADLVA
jgi:ATP-dependent Lhr-like helicase